jgi:hypothetical protein
MRKPLREFKNGFHADRLSWHPFLANAFRLLLYGFAYNLVNCFVCFNFRSRGALGANRNSAGSTVHNRRSRAPDGTVHPRFI